MSASPNGFEKDPERARRAGQKSRRKSWASVFERYEEEICKEMGVSDPDKLALATLVRLMQEGDLRATQEWLDRRFGKAKQITENTHEMKEAEITIKPRPIKAKDD